MRNKSSFTLLAVGLIIIAALSAIFLTTVPVLTIVTAIASVTFAVLSLRE